MLRWLGGVTVHEFIDSKAEGVFMGRRYNGRDITPAIFQNHVPPKFELWVDAELANLVEKGCLAKWSDIADTGKHPTPDLVLPLGVEPSKPRLFWDGRWLNNMCRRTPFTMDGVGKVSQVAWRGAYQVTLDHKSGFHHVPIDPESWTFFGLCWRGEYYVWTVLCFGWCSSPYIYHTLSEAVGQYLRARDVPVLVWIDDFYLTNFRVSRNSNPEQQAEAALAAVHLALCVFHRAGYFMSVEKCVLNPTTSLVYLGIVCDSAKCRFEVPEDKLVKLETLITAAIDASSITFAELEKVAGKCTSMTVAVPAASLYTFHMYKQIGHLQRTGKSRVSATVKVAPNGSLRAEFDRWLEVRARMNGATWFQAQHRVLSVSGATDASSSGWGGVMRGPDQALLEAAADFPDEWVEAHINEKEAYALLETIRLFSMARPSQIQGSTVVVDVDNQTVFYAFRKGKSPNARMHEVITSLFWLQVDLDFSLNLRWVCSADNKEADDLSRANGEEYVRLTQGAFATLWESWGGFDMDLMATTASTQRIPEGVQGAGEKLPFFSRYHTEESAGVDVLSQDVSKMPSSSRECFGFCFPPPSMVGVVLQHLAERRAHAVILVPDLKLQWFPKLAEATVRSQPVSGPGEDSQFFRSHHQRNRIAHRFHKWGMRAVEVDFRGIQ